MKSFQTVCCLGIISLILDIPVRAQIVPDNSVGTLLAPNTNIQGLPSDVINGGTKNGSNLFHSFQEFNVDASRGVYFNNPTDVTNIFTRVTGSNPSNINGTLGVLGNANLFFLNPNGIFFGSTAKLDVKGSFIGTTASSINFADSTQFNVATTQPSLLTVSVPVGLGFGSNPGKIDNRSIANGLGLQVPTNQSLLLVGGDVAITGGRQGSLGGNVELGGLASSGTVGLSTNGSAMSLSFHKGVARANVSLINEGINLAMVNVAGNNGGSITITANNIDINGSLLLSGIVTGLGFTGAQSGDISLNATGAVNIASSSILNTLGTGSTGNSGNINITAESVAMTNSSKLIASTNGQGNSGSVNINAKETVSFDGSGSAGFSTVVLNNVEPTGVGNSGGINVTAGKVSLTNGARLYTLISGQGSAGNININTRETVALDGVSKNLAFSSILSAVTATGVGRTGDVNITTGSLSILDGGQIGAGSYGRGDVGSLNINARDITFDGMGNSIGAPTGAFSLAGIPTSLGVVGNSSPININTNSLTLRNGAVITTSTFGQGNAGKVNINARESILFDGTGANGYPSGVGTTVEQQAVGNGGDIEIATKSLSLINGAGLAASSRGQGSGGSITVNANTLTAMNGGQILTNSSNTGNAGNITLNVQENVTLAGSDITYPERLAKFGEQRVVSISPESGIFANTSSNSQGRGGDLSIVTGKLVLSDGAIANVSSEGTGNAGNFTVTADSIKLDNLSSFKAENRVGEGGNITLDARNIMLRQNSNITTNATETATGGNININADTLVALENSDITANAIKGRGGNINITTQGIFRDFNSDITATSDVGINGSVNIRKPDINQQNNLIEQSSNFGNTDMAIAASCLVNRNIDKSKFVVTGNGGLPDTPSNTDIQYQTAPVRAVVLNNNIPSGQKNTLNSNLTWKLGDPIQEASQLVVSKDGRLLLKAINNDAYRTSQNITCQTVEPL